MDVREIDKNENETDDITYGIDVAKWQGVIDWAKLRKPVGFCNDTNRPRTW